ncbi:malate dehydrogenase [Bordetella trematum]|uniref:Ldh family oxidoreductase n=1 Tax=Bordetella trematum TaxID=123899 RepID=UPI000472B868|nr:Ldh family oxidoreductase [Bordetella trematum]CZZ99218.1 malate dehydrogenase [Bordetella trematum]
MSAPTATAARLTEWVAAVLQHAGVAPGHASLAAEVMVRTELRGVATHGLTRLASYLDKLRCGEVNPAPDIRVQRSPGICTIDADGALGQVAALTAMHEGLAMLETEVSVICRIRDCGHLGALGHYALLAAERGHIALVFQRTPPLMALPGYAGRAVGNNPIAFGCPVPGAAPLVFDMACSVAARGHILLAAREGRDIPADWALDGAGQPTTAADAALEGALLPMAAHKGMGLAIMAECLAGALAGAAPESRQKMQHTPRSGAAGGQSTLIWLVNPQCAGQSSFADYMHEWAAGFQLRGGAQARLPGARAAACEQAALADGLRIPAALARELEAVGQATGCPPPWAVE